MKLASGNAGKAAAHCAGRNQARVADGKIYAAVRKLGAAKLERTAPRGN